MRRTRNLAPLVVLLAAFFLGLFLACPALAQTRARGSVDPGPQANTRERRVALVIGNAAYTGDRLKNPVNDARAMAKTLGGLGFAVTRRENLNRRGMLAAIRAFGQELKNASVGLFYFAGRGMEIQGKNYLIPLGVRADFPEDLTGEPVSLDFLMARLQAAGNRLNLVILDAYRTNKFQRSFRDTSQGLASALAPSGTLIAYATQPGGTAAGEGLGRNGLYASQLIRFMQQPGLEIGLMFRKVREAVERLSDPKHTPWEHISLKGIFYFNPIQISAEKTGHRPTPATARLNDTNHWKKWQLSMELAWQRAWQTDRSEQLSPKSKLESWKRTLRSHLQNNPLSGRDEELRAKAEERINYWAALSSTPAKKKNTHNYWWARAISAGRTGGDHRPPNRFAMVRWARHRHRLVRSPGMGREPASSGRRLAPTQSSRVAPPLPKRHGNPKYRPAVQNQRLVGLD